MEYNVLVRVDSSDKIGTGHIFRMLNFVEQFDSIRFSFICKKFRKNLIHKIKYKVYELEADDDYVDINDQSTWLGENWEQDAVKTLNIIKQIGNVDSLIVDHYGVNKKWEKYLYNHVKNLTVVDDLGRSHYCDILQDQISLKHYTNVNSSCKQLIGSKYTIMNSKILDININQIEGLNKINISFGGVDATNETLRVVKIVDRVCPDIKCDIIMGGSNPHTESVLKYIEGKKQFKLYINLPNYDFLKLLSSADLTIGAAGLTTFERCILCRPTMYVKIAENQQGVVECLQKYDVGVYLEGDYNNMLEQLLMNCDKKYLESLIKNCPKMLNKSNVYNVKNIFERYIYEQNSSHRRG